MKFMVKAVALDTDSGAIVAGPREEEIDTETNSVFSDCTREDEIEDTYEAFWNRINGFTNNLPDGKIKVLTVTEVA